MSEAISSKTAVKSKEDLPPPRDRKGIRSVSPPLANTSMHRFSYYIVMFAATLLAFYAWRLTIWKAEAGSWWNLMLGKKPPIAREGESTPGTGAGWTGAPGSNFNKPAAMGDMSVEERINDLASALGVPNKELASAIASAVHEYVPPATISSIAASQTGEAVQYIIDPTGAAEADYSSTAFAPVATKGLKAAAMAFEAAVGLDEPPTEMT